MFILGSLFLFGELFTYENARYVLRDMSQLISDDSAVPADKIHYDADTEMDFGIYRSNLVVAGSSGVDIYGKSGVVKLSDDTDFISPVIASSEKYCIVYSLGAYNLSVYNTVARIYDMKFDFQIFDVALSDDGHIAVMTQSREYRCTVYLYDADFRLVATYNKSNYPSDVEFSQDNKSLYISTFGSDSGTYRTVFNCYQVGKSELLYTYNHYDELIYDCIPFESGTTALVADGSVVFLGSDGSVIKKEILDSGVSRFHSDGYQLSILSSDKNKKVLVYDSDGGQVYNKDVDNFDQIYSFDGQVYALQRNRIMSINDSSLDLTLDYVPQKIDYDKGYLFVYYTDNVISLKVE